jgi:hypothetical protein
MNDKGVKETEETHTQTQRERERVIQTDRQKKSQRKKYVTLT